MRSIVSIILLFALASLYWAGHAQLSAYMDVWRLERSDTEAFAIDEALLKLGYVALPSLRAGLKSGNLRTQMHCAKVLTTLGQNEGEAWLLGQLRLHAESRDPVGRTAEAFLIGAWDLRFGPDEATRRRLREAEAGAGHVPELALLLNEALQHFPNWADGYARRARIYQQASEAFEARRDALMALALAPNHWEAMVTLGRVQAAIDAPELALVCFQRALLVNPRLKNMLREDVRNALKAAGQEQEHRREERRKMVPVA